jgi:hypothetical protein
MHRRRLILLVALFSFVTVGWWFSVNPPLSIDERRLVGAWTGPAKSRSNRALMRYRPNRQAAWCIINPDGTPASDEFLSNWRICDGVLVIDGASVARRIVRPLGLMLNVMGGPNEFQLEMTTDDQMIVTWPNGDRETWNRVPEK